MFFTLPAESKAGSFFASVLVKSKKYLQISKKLLTPSVFCAKINKSQVTDKTARESVGV